jgi:hypothetical protein
MMIWLILAYYYSYHQHLLTIERARIRNLESIVSSIAKKQASKSIRSQKKLHYFYSCLVEWWVVLFDLVDLLNHD